MKKFNFKHIRIGKVNVKDLDSRVLLLNLYVTQALTLLIGLLLFLGQKQNRWLAALSFTPGWKIVLWGGGLAALVLAADMLISRWVPKEMTDDGGINELIFKNRPLWHIALLALVVAICEETLFRGAIQYAWGPYWTSVLFAAIHIRYWRHWLMTGMVFSISYGLGWVYQQTGTLWTPILAHFIIDFVLGCVLRYSKEEVES